MSDRGHPSASRQWCEDCLAWRHGLHGAHHFCPGELSGNLSTQAIIRPGDGPRRMTTRSHPNGTAMDRILA